MALEYLWRTFRRLARRRTSNGFSSNPITWPDIDAFVRRSKFALTPWEVEIIEDLDDIERAEQARVMQPEKSSGSKEED